MNGLSFDLTINLGQIMTLTGFFITAMVFTARLLVQVAALGARMAELEIEGKKQTEILIAMAETKIRLDNIDKRSDDRMGMLMQRIVALEAKRG